MNEEVKKIADRKVFPDNKELTSTEINARIRVLEMQKRELLKTVNRNYRERIRFLLEQKDLLLASSKSEQKGAAGQTQVKTENEGESSSN